MNIDYSPGKAYLKPLSGELFIFVHDFCTTFDDTFPVNMEYHESSVWISSGEFPYIRFGTGKKNLVMLAGMSMTGLIGLGEPVSEMYRDYVKEYTVFVFDRLRVLSDDASVLFPVPPAAVRMKWEKRPFRSGRRWQIKWTETAFTGTFSPGSIRFRTKRRLHSVLTRAQPSSAAVSESSPVPATISTAGTSLKEYNARCLCWVRRRIGCWAARPRLTLQNVSVVSISFIRTTDTRFAMKLRTFGSGCWTSCTKSYNHQDSLANMPCGVRSIDVKGRQVKNEKTP